MRLFRGIRELLAGAAVDFAYHTSQSVEEEYYNK